MQSRSYGAGVAWCRETNESVDVAPLVDAAVEAEPGVGARLLELGRLYERVGVSAVNGSSLALAVCKPDDRTMRGRVDAQAAEEAEAIIGEACDFFAAVPFGGERADAIAAELVAACRLLRHGLWRLGQQRGEDERDPAGHDVPAVRDALMSPRRLSKRLFDSVDDAKRRGAPSHCRAGVIPRQWPAARCDRAC
jgi:hypothetical protein